jgi:hypothetical protein
VHKALNTKGVDLTTPTTFTKAIRCFAQQVWHKMYPKFECHSVLMNKRCWQLTKISTLFHSKLEMTTYMKVVSLDKLDNFYIGRF